VNSCNRGLTHTALLQLFTLQLSSPQLPANGQFEKVSYVEYAPVDKILTGTADPGDGAVDVYSVGGRLLQRLILPNDTLDDPWAIVKAPRNFGSFSNDLLVGDFGDGTINAIRAHSGR
jgi:hypothetical protein